MNWIRSHLSFANAVSVIALFVALGGTGYAAITLPKNSVGSNQIRKNAVGRSEIRNNAVRSGEVRNGALRAVDFAAGQLPQGAKGEKGDKGDKGDLGTFDPTTATIVARRSDFALPAGPGANQPGAEVDGFETCEPGEKLIGGAVNTSSPAGATTLISRPSTDTIGNGGIPLDEEFSAWKGTARTETNVAATMRVFAICASKPATP